MSKLTSLIRRAPKRFSAVALMVAAAIIIPTVSLAWGPSRETFTIDNPSDHVQFNSITNNPNIGDERNFVGIRESTAANTWYDTMNVQSGKEYVVRMYVHNNAATSLNLVAKDVTAKVNLPTTTGKSIEVNGFISASNVGANAKGNAGAYAEVYDQATFTNSADFNLAYVAGSLKYENNAFGAAGTTLTESIFTSTGAKLGYDKLDGNIPGCFQYSGYVIFKVKANTSDFDIQKTVRINGATDKTFKESVAVKPGDKVDYQIYFKNTGATQLQNVVIKDTLPTGTTYVPGTTYLHNSDGTKLVADGVTTNGINIGGYLAGGDAYVKFTAQVADNDKLAVCGTNTLQNIAKATTTTGSKEDTADVTVPKTCKPNECKPGIPVGDKRCEVTPPVVTPPTVTPPELPHTGASDNIVAFLGAGTLVASIAYYVASRRTLA